MMNSADALQTRPVRPAPTPLVDISNIDLSQRMLTREDLEQWLPHRGVMSLLDGVIWHSENFSQGVAIKPVRDDEFWTAGHFPERPMLPGVLMIEAGAQLSSILFHGRSQDPRIAGFTRVKNAIFREQVHPGSDLLLLAREVKYNPRRFICDIQGFVKDRLAFEARIVGMML